MTPRSLLALALALTACDSPKPSPEAPQKAREGAEKAPAQSPPASASANPLADAAATAAVGQPAPDFSLPAADGSTVKLSDYRGKRVVIEWFNPECPFVKAAHDGGPLKDLAARTTAQGFVWLAINSGAPGKQGHGAEVNRAAAEKWALKHPILLDETGAVGRAYGATNTPHMYLIDDKGVLVYRGALDNAPMGESQEGPRVGYFEDAIAALAGGQPIAQGETRAWGCSVKYAK